jgi:hypothetical protein
MNYYWNGKITTIVENLKLLLLLEIICSDYCYWRLFIGIVVVGDYLLDPLLLDWKTNVSVANWKLLLLKLLLNPPLLKLL